MKSIKHSVILASFLALPASAFSAGTADDLARYNVVWDSPSRDSHGSMPLGNGDIGVNVWVEPSGDLVFYISKTDAWNESGRLCKVGRVRVKFDPPLPVSSRFRQELKLREGVMEITVDNSRLEMRVDANQPVVWLESESATPVNCRAEVELWRLRERPYGEDDDGHTGRGVWRATPPIKVLPDTVVTAAAPGVVWYHRNTQSVYPLCLKTQHLEALQDRFPDPLLDLVFGARLTGKGFVRDGALAIKSEQPARRHALAVTVLTARGDWLAQLNRLKPAPDRQAHAKWWLKFWERSWIFIGGKDTLTRGYVLQRYMNACAGRGGAPIKFNGSIFTVEASPGAATDTPAGDPDWRRWGGNYWFQNTRPAYWSMLASGDFDMMAPWFRMYRDALPLSKARIGTYYKFADAAQFPETMYPWGLPNNGDYGWNNTAPEPVNPFIRRYWSGSLELIAVMLDRYDFTRDRKFLRETLLPLAGPLIAYLDQYWPKRDANGKIIFDPAQSLETWHVAVNPLPEIAGLRFVLPRLLKLSAAPEQRARWQRMLDELPPIPVKEGRLQPAESFSDRENSENPELYAVYPYRLYGVGRPDLELARATYAARKFRHNGCWCQDSIQAAFLGLGDEAGRLVAARAAQINTAYRFPVMWGPNFDWVPDQDHGNNILTTLQYMLLQSDGDKLLVLPAWPKGWNCSFKLHAPGNTTIECEYRDGRIVELDVRPRSRRADLHLMLPGIEGKQ